MMAAAWSGPVWTWTFLAIVTEVVLIVDAVVTYDADDFVTHCEGSLPPKVSLWGLPPSTRDSEAG
jgi:hypothetical protein